ncbi:MAG: hypothetical protein Q8K30_06105 [Candidatus Gracilibacteria bacterium]|nr:hypothetical protein [Candidatus Gracilibacteria bacterium]
MKKIIFLIIMSSFFINSANADIAIRGGGNDNGFGFIISVVVFILIFTIFYLIDKRRYDNEKNEKLFLNENESGKK